MKQADKIKELEERIKQLEAAPRTYPVYVYPQPVVAPVYPSWQPYPGYPIVYGTGVYSTGTAQTATSFEITAS